MKFVIIYHGKEQKLSIPKYYKFSYTMWVMDADVYYPIGIHLIVRYWVEWRWKPIRWLWRLGLIDIKADESFRWSDFYRIKSH